jgi:hypothetical protein
MIEILKYIFSSFWIFAGVTIWLGMIVAIVIGIFGRNGSDEN